MLTATWLMLQLSLISQMQPACHAASAPTYSYTVCSYTINRISIHWPLLCIICLVIVSLQNVALPLVTCWTTKLAGLAVCEGRIQLIAYKNIVSLWHCHWTNLMCISFINVNTWGSILWCFCMEKVVRGQGYPYPDTVNCFFLRMWLLLLHCYSISAATNATSH